MKTMRSTTMIMMAVAAMIVIAAASSATYAQEPTSNKVAVFDANNTVTVNRQTDNVWQSSDLESTIVSGFMFGDREITREELYENGSAVATITGSNFTGAKYYYNHTITPEFGFTYTDNGTIITPEGEQVKMVFGE